MAWRLAAALFASIIPFAVILRGVRSGALTDYHIDRREPRRTLLLIALACVAVGLLGMVAPGAERELLAALGAGTCGLMVLLTVNRWWKMSVHTGVAAGAVVVFSQVFGPAVLALAPVVLVVAWSRVRLRDHIPAQAIVGFVLGALTAGLAFAALRWRVGWAALVPCCTTW